MNIFDTVFVLFTALWVGEFIMKRGKQSTSESSIENRSFLLILFMIISSIAATLSFRELDLFLFNTSALTNVIGLLLYGGGIGLRYWGIQELGHFFSRNVIVESKVDLVSSGPYRLLRHPLYTGLLLSTIGIPIYIGAWGGVIVAVLLIIPALLFRIRLEERMLYESVGESYREWGKDRYRLVPFIY
ncbi:methyltransferase family protein [Pseudalkalibacillus hwajinpoensis]|uniref:Isoprenylcysteine carboxylmethyltransferase family protein n=1 Tax=Guptibacillus hwajinpoensis TaxID=208199 RepID=A0A4U1MEG7_9BACL|nr:isoprenylcysteine carboxylmethyltransferase family protein [Pseudalkalibacillus hwajinpoensis]TKD69193.1 isoprenylcysteine carboxylmethyltransferase family protein [Pseudalkalibacillus hwajinpoensis]